MLAFQVLGSLLQNRPKVPKFVPVDVTQQQSEALQGNIQNLPKMQQIAGSVNAFNTEQFLERLRKVIPNYDELMKEGSGKLDMWGDIVKTMMKGQIPTDVKDQVGRTAAERSAAGGFAGSGMRDNLEARDLGLTSLGIIGQGLSSAERWLNSTAQWASQGNSQPLDFSGFMQSPEFRTKVAIGERDSQFQRNWVNNQLKAEYSTGTQIGKAIIKTDDQIMQIMASVAGSAGGAMMCWIAREVFGPSNPKWVIFRDWMLTEAPRALRDAYIIHGEKAALFISDKPALKSKIRNWMESMIESRKAAYGII